MSNDDVHALTLPSGRRVELAAEDGEERITVRAESGDCLVQIALTPDGPMIRLSGARLEIAASERLTLASEEVRIAAGALAIEVAGDVEERVGGDATRAITGASRLEARDVALVAQPGGMRLEANDDVDVRGERVRLNSDDPPMPATWEEHRRRHGGTDG